MGKFRVVSTPILVSISLGDYFFILGSSSPLLHIYLHLFRLEHIRSLQWDFNTFSRSKISEIRGFRELSRERAVDTVFLDEWPEGSGGGGAVNERGWGWARGGSSIVVSGLAMGISTVSSSRSRPMTPSVICSLRVSMTIELSRPSTKLDWTVVTLDLWCSAGADVDSEAKLSLSLSTSLKRPFWKVFIWAIRLGWLFYVISRKKRKK